MTTYYIDPTASTGGDGTFATPFDSWADVTWAAGNTYLQKEGSVFYGTITFTAGGTSESTRVIIGTYDAVTGAQILDGRTRAIVDVNGGQFGIVGSGTRNYVRVHGMEVRNARHTSNATGIYSATNGGSYFETLYCYVHDIKNSNDTVGSCGIKSFSDNAKHKYNVVCDMGDDGIYCEGDNVEIAYNKVYSVSTVTIGGDCVQMADTFTSSNTPWIHHNLLDHTNKDTKQCFIITSGGAGGPSVGGIVEYNIMQGFEKAVVHKTLYCGSANMVVRHNYLSGGTRTIDADSNSATILIHSNVLVNSTSNQNTNGIVITAINASITNNTIVNTSGDFTNTVYGIQIGNYTGCVVYNNIFSGWKYGLRINSGGATTENYNCFYNNTVNKVNESLTTQTLGANSITTSPELSASFVSKPGNAVYGVGLFTSYIADYTGQVFKNPPSIGAHEYMDPRGDAGTRGTR